MLTRSIFVLAPRGDTPSTQRLYDAAESCSIPVLISDSVFAEGTPFQCLVPVKEMSLTVSEQKIMRNAGGALQELMDIVGKERRNAMRYFLVSVRASAASPRAQRVGNNVTRCIKASVRLRLETHLPILSRCARWC